MNNDPLIVFDTRTAGLGRRALQEYARDVRDRVARGRLFCCLVTSDDHLQQLNRDFRGKDYPTDVLSFPSSSPDGALGDLAISVHRAAEQAREHGHDTNAELRILLLHGVLHLLGYDHETDRGRMRRAESRWRKQLGLPSGLIERTHR